MSGKQQVPALLGPSKKSEVSKPLVDLMRGCQVLVSQVARCGRSCGTSTPATTSPAPWQSPPWASAATSRPSWRRAFAPRRERREQSKGWFGLRSLHPSAEMCFFLSVFAGNQSLLDIVFEGAKANGGLRSSSVGTPSTQALINKQGIAMSVLKHFQLLRSEGWFGVRSLHPSTPSKMEYWGTGVTCGDLHLWFHVLYGEDYRNGIGDPPPRFPLR